MPLELLGGCLVARVRELDVGYVPLGPEGPDEDRVYARRPVPFGKGVQEVEHGVEAPVVRHDGEGRAHIELAELHVAPCQECHRLRIVRVGPCPRRRRGVPPRDGPRELAFVHEDVVCDVPEVGIVLDDCAYVEERVLELVAAPEREDPLPVGRHLLISREVVPRLSRPGSQDLVLYLRILPCEVAHRAEGGQAVDRRQLGRICVEISEAMHPDEVEGVQELSAGGIACMVGVCEDVVVDDDARLGVRRDVVVVVGRSAAFVPGILPKRHWKW